jgi:hypothetical protein
MLTIVTSIQLPMDDASAATAATSVTETHAAEIHQETGAETMANRPF